MNASGTLAEATHEIAPRGSHRVRVNDVAGIEGEHATLVRGVWADDGLPAPIVAERTITWGNDIEGHSTRGVPFPSPTWVVRRGQPGRPVVDVPAADEPVPSRRDGGGPLPAGDGAVAALHVHRAAAAAVHGGAADHRRVRHRRAIGGVRRSVAVPIIAERAMDFGQPWTSATRRKARRLRRSADVRRRIDRRRTLLRSVPAARQPVHRRRARAARFPALERQRLQRHGDRRRRRRARSSRGTRRRSRTGRSRPRWSASRSRPAPCPRRLSPSARCTWSGNAGWYAGHSTMGMP